jgi:hypothetical protein
MIGTDGLILISFFSLVMGIVIGYGIAQIFEINREQEKHRTEMLKWEITSDVIDHLEKILVDKKSEVNRE